MRVSQEVPSYAYLFLRNFWGNFEGFWGNFEGFLGEKEKRKLNKRKMEVPELTPILVEVVAT